MKIHVQVKGAMVIVGLSTIENCTEEKKIFLLMMKEEWGMIKEENIKEKVVGDSKQIVEIKIKKGSNHCPF